MHECKCKEGLIWAGHSEESHPSIATLYRLLYSETLFYEEILYILGCHVFRQVGNVKGRGWGAEVALKASSGLVVPIPINSGFKS